MSETKTALVLSGGGSLGAVQAGMLQALSRARLPINMVIGTSVGALNAAYFANDPTPEGADALAALWSGLRRRDIFPGSLVTAGLKALLLRRGHLMEASGLRALIRRALRLRRIEDARVPLKIVATDVLSGSEVLLSSGEVEPALLASTAIPAIFPPMELEGRFLVDGGVSSNTPIATAVKQGAEHIVVLPTGTTCAARTPPHSMTALALHALNLLSMRQLDRDVSCGTMERFAMQKVCPHRQSRRPDRWLVCSSYCRYAGVMPSDWLSTQPLRTDRRLWIFRTVPARV